MKITTTRTGLRLSQHGVVISLLRTSPGPTHSVFDVLAALIAILQPLGRIGVLGFAGGGMMAPLRGLGVEAVIDSVDLDRAGYDLFRQHCPGWASGVNWQQADAVAWLRRQRLKFDLLMDDLSVPHHGDVVKPTVCWSVLPELIHRRLRPGGVAIFNLMLPSNGNWNPDLNRLAGRFKAARIIDFDEFENRILIGGDDLPSARELGLRLRRALRLLRSRQAGRIHLRQLLSSCR
jgi:SAM-dependent methyltransferase